MNPSPDRAAGDRRLGLRELGKRQRTERILDAALDLLRTSRSSALPRAQVAPMTVFNLVGNRDQMWSALADRALQDLDLRSISADDPQERAREIVDAVVRILRTDAAVFRALLTGWSQSGRVPEHDPTDALVECLQAAADAGQIRSDVNLRRHGEVIAAGLVGTIHQWTAGLISDRAFAARARAVVDVVFAAARCGDETR